MRPPIALRDRLSGLEPLPIPQQLTSEEPGPYEAYSRTLTREGGILIVYKDIDLRLRYTLWRLLAWASFTGGEGWYLLDASPVESSFVNLLCLVAVATLNWLIVRSPVECQRRIEIRHDCLIIDGAEVFWRSRMEGDWPALQPDDDKVCQRLCGIYGTRFVEFLTVHRFDELDRTPEVLAAHLLDAFNQLWKA